MAFKISIETLSLSSYLGEILEELLWTAPHSYPLMALQCRIFHLILCVDLKGATDAHQLCLEAEFIYFFNEADASMP